MNSWVRKICWKRDRLPTPVFLGFPGGSNGKESGCNAGDLGSIPGLGRSPGEGEGYPLQYSGLENSMDYIVHGVTNSWTQLNDFHFHFRPTHGVWSEADLGGCTCSWHNSCSWGRRRTWSFYLQKASRSFPKRIVLGSEAYSPSLSPALTCHLDYRFVWIWTFGSFPN